MSTECARMAARAAGLVAAVLLSRGRAEARGFTMAKTLRSPSAPTSSSFTMMVPTGNVVLPLGGRLVQVLAARTREMGLALRGADGADGEGTESASDDVGRPHFDVSLRKLKVTFNFNRSTGAGRSPARFAGACVPSRSRRPPDTP